MEQVAISQSAEFKIWIKELKSHIRQSQTKAFVKVNTEMLKMYWYLGEQIEERQKNAIWGSGFLQALSKELLSEFPDMNGFSYRNLRYIRQWHEMYAEYISNWQQLVAKIKKDDNDTN